MAGVLDGMRIVEGSAFVAIPLGGMTLAQLGADVIRFDPIGGGLDYSRWPVTAEGRTTRESHLVFTAQKATRPSISLHRLAAYAFTCAL